MYIVLRKKEKKIKNEQKFYKLSYLFTQKIISYTRVIILDLDKKWMLMTYYCPTHGHSGIVQPIEISKKEISETFSKKASNSKK